VCYYCSGVDSEDKAMKMKLMENLCVRMVSFLCDNKTDVAVSENRGMASGTAN
jgi:hypothetical protein